MAGYRTAEFVAEERRQVELGMAALQQKLGPPKIKEFDTSKGLSIGMSRKGIWLADRSGIVCPRGHITRAYALRCARRK